MAYTFIMSEDNKSIDATQIASAKDELSHVETESQKSNVKPVFKCDACGETQDIPADLLAKMENDEDISASIPSHCGQTMKISVVA